MLISVDDTENRARMKLARAVDEVKKLLVPTVSQSTSTSAVPLSFGTLVCHTQGRHRALKVLEKNCPCFQDLESPENKVGP